MRKREKKAESRKQKAEETKKNKLNNIKAYFKKHCYTGLTPRNKKRIDQKPKMQKKQIFNLRKKEKDVIELKKRDNGEE